MNRAQLEQLIRAAATIADDDEIVILGSQSVLGQFSQAPPGLLVSMEADLYPRSHPERWDLIDGTIGEGSPFHETFGYYAQGVGPETARLPAGWESRCIRGEAFREQMALPALVLERLGSVAIEQARREAAASLVRVEERLAKASSRPAAE